MINPAIVESLEEFFDVKNFSDTLKKELLEDPEKYT